MKFLLRVVVLKVILLFAFQIKASDSDKLLEKKIIGVWLSNSEWTHPDYPNKPIVDQGKDDYGADGVVRGFTISQYPESKRNWSYESKWWIKDSYLYMEIISESLGLLKQGFQTRDKILSISDKKMVLLAEDGTRLVRYRK
ncbi:hypothetical protein [Aliikangiella sp. IMCC44359]|uniref:hypothetical protein n=1 Tax=Aliikangiella sp. IMCC44359 TaxID=3459125 RepID=UPI00403AA5D0